MRFIAIILIIGSSAFTYGQEIRIAFKDTITYENFTRNNFTFPQKYNASELFIVENQQYRLKRISKTSTSIAYAKLDDELSSFELQTNIALQKTKNKDASGGVVLHGQPNGNGAIILEINSKGKFKMTKAFNNQVRYLSGTPKEEGWVKNKSINKKGSNAIKVKVAKGYYSVYFNNQLAFTAYDAQYTSGRFGYYVNANSEMVVYDVLLKKERTGLEIPTTDGSGTTTTSDGIDDPEFNEVIQLFKNKIDKQEVTIKALQREVDKCKSTLNYDTALVSDYSFLKKDYRKQQFKLDSTTRALQTANKRLVYLESLKEDLENSADGDLAISMSKILAEVKTENKELKAKVNVLNDKNTTLKKDNEVLLREIQKLEYLLKQQE